MNNPPCQEAILQQATQHYLNTGAREPLRNLLTEVSPATVFQFFQKLEPEEILAVLDELPLRWQRTVMEKLTSGQLKYLRQIAWELFEVEQIDPMEKTSHPSRPSPLRSMVVRCRSLDSDGGIGSAKPASHRLLILWCAGASLP